MIIQNPDFREKIGVFCVAQIPTTQKMPVRKPPIRIECPTAVCSAHDTCRGGGGIPFALHGNRAWSSGKTLVASLLGNACVTCAIFSFKKRNGHKNRFYSKFAGHRRRRPLQNANKIGTDLADARCAPLQNSNKFAIKRIFHTFFLQNPSFRFKNPLTFFKNMLFSFVFL